MDVNDHIYYKKCCNQMHVESNEVEHVGKGGDMSGRPQKLVGDIQFLGVGKMRPTNGKMSPAPLSSINVFNWSSLICDIVECLCGAFFRYTTCLVIPTGTKTTQS